MISIEFMYNYRSYFFQKRFDYAYEMTVILRFKMFKNDVLLPVNITANYSSLI